MSNQYAGMTVNERLYVSGLMDEFDKAVEGKDIDKILQILKAVGITDNSLVKPILDHFGLPFYSDEGTD
ncbi:MAG: hypothetical protein ABS46_18045 [Cytophagaceae bacterium SCN 52-12]|nr:MAG: hypothetical protein ABS46_18045 [Cytophagaceae bacterium SCN 52-12]